MRSCSRRLRCGKMWAAILAVLSFVSVHLVVLNLESVQAQQNLLRGSLPSVEGSARELSPTDLFRIGTIFVEGNQRLPDSAIRDRLEIREGDQASAEKIDAQVKRLFASGYFRDVSIDIQEGNDILIRVAENPLVNYVVFEGNRRIPDNALAAEVSLKPNAVYSAAKAQFDANRIVQIYQRTGRFTVSVQPKVILLDRNRVNIVFEISERKVSSIRKISFIGNETIPDNVLVPILLSREDAWYRFLSSVVSYDEARIEIDRQLLQQFYLNSGFASAQVLEPISEVSLDGTQFFISYPILEGPRYRFGSLEIKIDLPDVTAEDFEPLLQEIVRYNWYSRDWLDTVSAGIVDHLGKKGYAFVQVTIDEQPVIPEDSDSTNPEQNINVVFEVLAPRTVVKIDQVEIIGNFKTYDEVIRQRLQIAEGDTYNSGLIQDSLQRLRSTGYFSEVDVSVAEGAESDLANLAFKVEEQGTGSIRVGGGYSTFEGPLLNLTYSDTNLVGTGNSVSVNGNLGLSFRSLGIRYGIPYFQDTTAGLGLSANFSSYEATQNRSYSGSSFSYGVGISDRYTDHLSQRWDYTVNYNTYYPNDSTSVAIRRQAGEYFTGIVATTLSYNRIDYDQGNQPRGGFLISGQVSGAGIPFGNTSFLKLTTSVTSYFSLARNFTIKAQLSGSHIVPHMGRNVPRIFRYGLGGYSLFGFSSIGPRDELNNYTLGGRSAISGRLSMNFNVGLPEEYGITGVTFLDLGVLTDSGDDIPNLHDSGRLRVGGGIGLNWVTSFLPLHILFTRPLVWDVSDVPLSFIFGFGTQL